MKLYVASVTPPTSMHISSRQLGGKLIYFNNHLSLPFISLGLDSHTLSCLVHHSRRGFETSRRTTASVSTFLTD